MTILVRLEDGCRFLNAHEKVMKKNDQNVSIEKETGTSSPYRWHSLSALPENCHYCSASHSDIPSLFGSQVEADSVKGWASDSDVGEIEKLIGWPRGRALSVSVGQHCSNSSTQVCSTLCSERRTKEEQDTLSQRNKNRMNEMHHLTAYEHWQRTKQVMSRIKLEETKEGVSEAGQDVSQRYDQELLSKACFQKQCSNGKTDVSSDKKQRLDGALHPRLDSSASPTSVTSFYSADRNSSFINEHSSSVCNQQKNDDTGQNSDDEDNVPSDEDSIYNIFMSEKFLSQDPDFMSNSDKTFVGSRDKDRRDVRLTGLEKTSSASGQHWRDMLKDKLVFENCYEEFKRTTKSSSAYSGRLKKVAPMTTFTDIDQDKPDFHCKSKPPRAVCFTSCPQSECFPPTSLASCKNSLQNELPLLRVSDPMQTNTAVRAAAGIAAINCQYPDCQLSGEGDVCHFTHSDLIAQQMKQSVSKSFCEDKTSITLPNIGKEFPDHKIQDSIHKGKGKMRHNPLTGRSQSSHCILTTQQEPTEAQTNAAKKQWMPWWNKSGPSIYQASVRAAVAHPRRSSISPVTYQFKVPARDNCVPQGAGHRGSARVRPFSISAQSSDCCTDVCHRSKSNARLSDTVNFDSNIKQVRHVRSAGHAQQCEGVPNSSQFQGSSPMIKPSTALRKSSGIAVHGKPATLLCRYFNKPSKVQTFTDVMLEHEERQPTIDNVQSQTTSQFEQLRRSPQKAKNLDSGLENLQDGNRVSTHLLSNWCSTTVAAPPAMRDASNMNWDDRTGPLHDVESNVGIGLQDTDNMGTSTDCSTVITKSKQDICEVDEFSEAESSSVDTYYLGKVYSWGFGSRGTPKYGENAVRESSSENSMWQQGSLCHLCPRQKISDRVLTADRGSFHRDPKPKGPWNQQDRRPKVQGQDSAPVNGEELGRQMAELKKLRMLITQAWVQENGYVFLRNLLPNLLCLEGLSPPQPAMKQEVTATLTSGSTALPKRFRTTDRGQTFKQSSGHRPDHRRISCPAMRQEARRQLCVGDDQKSSDTIDNVPPTRVKTGIAVGNGDSDENMQENKAVAEHFKNTTCFTAEIGHSMGCVAVDDGTDVVVPELANERKIDEYFDKSELPDKYICFDNFQKETHVSTESVEKVEQLLLVKRNRKKDKWNSSETHETYIRPIHAGNSAKVGVPVPSVKSKGNEANVSTDKHNKLESNDTNIFTTEQVTRSSSSHKADTLIGSIRRNHATIKQSESITGFHTESASKHETAISTDMLSTDDVAPVAVKADVRVNYRQSENSCSLTNKNRQSQGKLPKCPKSVNKVCSMKAMSSKAAWEQSSQSRSSSQMFDMTNSSCVPPSQPVVHKPDDNDKQHWVTEDNSKQQCDTPSLHSKSKLDTAQNKAASATGSKNGPESTAPITDVNPNECTESRMNQCFVDFTSSVQSTMHTSNSINQTLSHQKKNCAVNSTVSDLYLQRKPSVSDSANCDRRIRTSLYKHVLNRDAADGYEDPSGSTAVGEMRLVLVEPTTDADTESKVVSLSEMLLHLSEGFSCMASSVVGGNILTSGSSHNTLTSSKDVETVHIRDTVDEKQSVGNISVNYVTEWCPTTSQPSSQRSILKHTEVLTHCNDPGFSFQLTPAASSIPNSGPESPLNPTHPTVSLKHHDALRPPEEEGSDKYSDQQLARTTSTESPSVSRAGVRDLQTSMKQSATSEAVNRANSAPQAEEHPSKPNSLLIGKLSLSTEKPIPYGEEDIMGHAMLTASSSSCNKMSGEKEMVLFSGQEQISGDEDFSERAVALGKKVEITEENIAGTKTETYGKNVVGVGRKPGSFGQSVVLGNRDEICRVVSGRKAKSSSEAVGKRTLTIGEMAVLSGTKCKTCGETGIVSGRKGESSGGKKTVISGKRDEAIGETVSAVGRKMGIVSGRKGESSGEKKTVISGKKGEAIGETVATVGRKTDTYQERNIVSGRTSKISGQRLVSETKTETVGNKVKATFSRSAEASGAKYVPSGGKTETLHRKVIPSRTKSNISGETVVSGRKAATCVGKAVVSGRKAATCVGKGSVLGRKVESSGEKTVTSKTKDKAFGETVIASVGKVENSGENVKVSRTRDKSFGKAVISVRTEPPKEKISRTTAETSCKKVITLGKKTETCRGKASKVKTNVYGNEVITSREQVLSEKVKITFQETSTVTRITKICDEDIMYAANRTVGEKMLFSGERETLSTVVSKAASEESEDCKHFASVGRGETSELVAMSVETENHVFSSGKKEKIFIENADTAIQTFNVSGDATTTDRKRKDLFTVKTIPTSKTFGNIHASSELHMGMSGQKGLLRKRMRRPEGICESQSPSRTAVCREKCKLPPKKPAELSFCSSTTPNSVRKPKPCHQVNSAQTPSLQMKMGVPEAPKLQTCVQFQKPPIKCPVQWHEKKISSHSGEKCDSDKKDIQLKSSKNTLKVKSADIASKPGTGQKRSSKSLIKKPNRSCHSTDIAGTTQQSLVIPAPQKALAKTDKECSGKMIRRIYSLDTGQPQQAKAATVHSTDNKLAGQRGHNVQHQQRSRKKSHHRKKPEVKSDVQLAGKAGIDRSGEEKQGIISCSFNSCRLENDPAKKCTAQTDARLKRSSDSKKINSKCISIEQMNVKEKSKRGSNESVLLRNHDGPETWINWKENSQHRNLMVGGGNEASNFCVQNSDPQLTAASTPATDRTAEKEISIARITHKTGKQRRSVKDKHVLWQRKKKRSGPSWSRSRSRKNAGRRRTKKGNASFQMRRRSNIESLHHRDALSSTSSQFQRDLPFGPSKSMLYVNSFGVVSSLRPNMTKQSLFKAYQGRQSCVTFSKAMEMAHDFYTPYSEACVYIGNQIKRESVPRKPQTSDRTISTAWRYEEREDNKSHLFPRANLNQILDPNHEVENAFGNIDCCSENATQNSEDEMSLCNNFHRHGSMVRHALCPSPIDLQQDSSRDWQLGGRSDLPDEPVKQRGSEDTLCMKHASSQPVGLMQSANSKEHEQHSNCALGQSDENFLGLSVPSNLPGAACSVKSSCGSQQQVWTDSDILELEKAGFEAQGDTGEKCNVQVMQCPDLSNLQSCWRPSMSGLQTSSHSTMPYSHVLRHSNITNAQTIRQTSMQSGQINFPNMIFEGQPKLSSVETVKSCKLSSVESDRHVPHCGVPVLSVPDVGEKIWKWLGWSQGNGTAGKQVCEDSFPEGEHKLPVRHDIRKQPDSMSSVPLSTSCLPSNQWQSSSLQQPRRAGTNCRQVCHTSSLKTKQNKRPVQFIPLDDFDRRLNMSRAAREHHLSHSTTSMGYSREVCPKPISSLPLQGLRMDTQNISQSPVSPFHSYLPHQRLVLGSKASCLKPYSFTKPDHDIINFAIIGKTLL